MAPQGFGGVTWGGIQQGMILTIQPFCNAKKTFCICVTWHDVLVVMQSTNLTEAITTAKFEVCIVWLHENCYLVRGE